LGIPFFISQAFVILQPPIRRPPTRRAAEAALKDFRRSLLGICR